MNITLVYIVAGMSSRFGGRIKSSAKVGPNGEILIEYSVNQAIKSGFNKIIFVVSKQTESFFRNLFGNNYKGIKIEYAFQKFDTEKRDKPWGTCDALCSAKELINEPFVVCTGDDLYGEKTFEILFNHLNDNSEDATASKKLIDMLPEKGEVNRGIFKINQDSFVTKCEELIGISRKNLNEKNVTQDTPASISIFALHPKTLEYLNENLNKFKEKNKDDRKIECFLNVELSELIEQGKIKMKLYFTPEEYMGITNPNDEYIIKQKLIKKT